MSEQQENSRQDDTEANNSEKGREENEGELRLLAFPLTPRLAAGGGNLLRKSKSKAKTGAARAAAVMNTRTLNCVA